MRILARRNDGYHGWAVQPRRSWCITFGNGGVDVHNDLFSQNSAEAAWLLGPGYRDLCSVMANTKHPFISPEPLPTFAAGASASHTGFIATDIAEATGSARLSYGVHSP